MTAMTTSHKGDLSERGRCEFGNNIVAQVPDLLRVYTDPAVLGAARSLCGPGCDLHSHRHAHDNGHKGNNDLQMASGWLKQI